jgi:cytidine deaminase
MDRELFKAALGVRPHAHAPYSRFPVGAALRTRSGAVFVGCNVENASFPEGWCAETSAIAVMASATDPGDREIAAVCVVADTLDGQLVGPCGGCRQRIAEFARPETLIHCYDPNGNGRSFRFAELLPAAFVFNGSK